MQNGAVAELIEDTAFYKKGQRAVIIDICGNTPKFHIRYNGENYCGNDVDIMPKHLFKEVKA